jgi:hypothetical protein
MPPRFLFNTDLTLSVNAPLNGVTYKEREVQLIMVFGVVLVVKGLVA